MTISILMVTFLFGISTANECWINDIDYNPADAYTDYFLTFMCSCSYSKEINASVLGITETNRSLILAEIYIQGKGLVLENSLRLKSVRTSSSLKLNLLGIDGVSNAYDMTTFASLSQLDALTVSIDFSDLRVIDAQSRCTIARLNCSQDRHSTVLIWHKQNKYHQDTCIGLLFSFNPSALFIFNLVNSLLMKNELGFVDLDESNQCNMTLALEYLELSSLYRPNLSSRLFITRLSSQLGTIKISGVLGRVDEGLFAQIRVNKIIIALQNSAEFHSLNPKWFSGLNNLNSQVRVFFKEHSKKRFESNEYSTLIPLYFYKRREFQYPDESFCMFKHYPVTLKWLQVLFDMRDRPKLSCTILFLSLSLFVTEDFIQTYLGYYSSEFQLLIEDTLVIQLINHRKNLTAMITQCGLGNRLKKCDLQNATRSSNVDIESHSNPIYGVIRDVQMAKFIVSVILRPVFCLVGVTANALVCRACLSLRRMEKKRIKNVLQADSMPLYNYILLNSLAGLFYSFLSLFPLMIECLSFNSVFCSSWLNSQQARLAHLFLVSYLSSTFKTIACLSQSSLVSYRYLMNVKKREGGVLSRLYQIRSKTVLYVIVVFSFLINSANVFHNQKMSWQNIQILHGLELFVVDRFLSKYTNTQIGLVVAYTANLVLVDVFCVVYDLLVDTLLLNYASQISVKAASSSSSRSQKDNAEKRLSKALALGILVNLLFKLPHFFVSLYNIGDFVQATAPQEPNFFSLCWLQTGYFESICTNLADITECLLLLAFSSNFLLLVISNKNFSDQLFNFKPASNRAN
nr:G protein-coupled receptor [Proales similis]